MAAAPGARGPYEPFTLKYRPRIFSDVVGQEAVSATLSRSVALGRVPNAFLFCGSRGVGKTSMARILAKALNCPQAGEGEPCGRCETCASIARGDDMDVIEVDGASNRGIDEIRTIRDNAAYAPARGRFKIYIIDEVHMLTVPAFNAILKTLEEPPPHVKFIFATTEAHAVPETIVSRCQKHEFRRISVADIVRRMEAIAEREGLAVKREILAEIADRAEGGLRDSLSLLDQLVAYAGVAPAVEDLDRVLGRLDRKILIDLVLSLGEGDMGRILDCLDLAFESGRDASDVLDQVCEVFRIALVRTARGLPGGGEGLRGEIVAKAREHFDLDRLVFVLRLCLNARREIKIAGLPRYQLEVALIKIARSADLLPLATVLSDLSPMDRSGTVATERRVLRRVPPAGAESNGDPAPPPDSAVEPPIRKPVPSLPVIQAEWRGILGKIKAVKPRIAALLEVGRPSQFSDGLLTVSLPAGQSFHKKQLETAGGPVVAAVLSEVLGAPVRVVYHTSSPAEERGRPPEQRVLDHPPVRKIVDAFSGSVLKVDTSDSGAAAEAAGGHSAGIEEAEDEGI